MKLGKRYNLLQELIVYYTIVSKFYNMYLSRDGDIRCKNSHIYYEEAHTLNPIENV